MSTLTLTLHEAVTGCTVDDCTQTVTMEVDGAYGESASIEVGIESGTEIDVELDGHIIELSAESLEGPDSERIQFAADMTADVVRSLNNRNERLEEKISALQARLNEAKVAVGATAKLANVWAAVSEYLSEDLPPAPADSYLHGYALAKARAKNALRDMGLEPKPETVEVVND